jgi:alpha-glucosidase
VQSPYLLLDFVPNHTSHRHPWFLESRASRDNPKRDWYVWVNPAPAGGLPNNWLSRFGGSAWERDTVTEQYYYHAFLKEQPDLNWRNPQVRAAMADVLRFWLRRGVDGFRIDAAAVLAEDVRLLDDPPNLEADERTPPPEHFKRVYSDNRPEVLEWLGTLRAVVEEFPDRVLLGEVDTSEERLAQFYGDPERPILHAPLNYRLLDTPWEAQAIAAIIKEYLGGVPRHGWPNWVLGSHDKKRVASRIGAEQARGAALLLLTLPGTPIFYAGDELGMTDVPVPSEQSRDPFERHVPGYGLNRDPEHAPMQWEASAHAGFTTGTPWLPIAPDYVRHNVEVQRADPHSMLRLYRRLIGLRHSEPALAVGGCQPLGVYSPLLTYLRTEPERRLLVVVNFSAQPQTGDLAGFASGRVRLSTYLDREGERLSGPLTLRGHEGLVMAVDVGHGAGAAYE